VIDDVRIYDRALNEEEVMEIYQSLIKINRNPIIKKITPSIDPTVFESPYGFVDFSANAIDPDGDKIFYQWYIDNEYVGSNVSYKFISDFGSVGTYKVEVVIRDNNGGEVRYSWSLTVENTNEKPLINKFELPDAVEDLPYGYLFSATDPDLTNDKITWKLKTDSSFLSINSTTGFLIGLPTNDDVGEWFCNIMALDGNGGVDSLNLTLKVINVNDDPEILNNNLELAWEDTPYNKTYKAIDIDPTNDNLIWELQTDAGFLMIDQDTGQLSGVPGEVDIGIWEVRISVSDGNEGSDSTGFILNVFGVNDPPKIKEQNLNFMIDEDYKELVLDLNEYFIDTDSDKLEFSYLPPKNFSIDTDNGIANIIPVPNWSGDETLRFIAGDSEFEIYIDVHITVKPINDAPYDVRIITEDMDYNRMLSCIATDPDLEYGDKHIYYWETNITGALGFGEKIKFTLPNGKYNVSVTVIDSAGESDSTTFELVIESERLSQKDDANKKGENYQIWIISVVVVALILILFVTILYFKNKKKPLNQNQDKDGHPRVLFGPTKHK
jgi:hypothetical protein